MSRTVLAMAETICPPHIEGRHPMLYFNIQSTEKYSIAMCYEAWSAVAREKIVRPIDNLKATNSPILTSWLSRHHRHRCHLPLQRNSTTLAIFTTQHVEKKVVFLGMSTKIAKLFTASFWEELIIPVKDKVRQERRYFRERRTVLTEYYSPFIQVSPLGLVDAPGRTVSSSVMACSWLLGRFWETQKAFGWPNAIDVVDLVKVVVVAVVD